MATSTRSAGAGADNAGVGTVVWSNPGNITASDDSKASATGNNNKTTHYLVASTFGFAIPAGATIDGIAARIEWGNSTGIGATISRVRIVKGGSIGTDERAADAETNIPDVNPDAYFTYGSASQLWAETWTADDINAAGFGLALSVILDPASDGDSAVVTVDHIELTVHYTAAATGHTRMALLGVG